MTEAIINAMRATQLLCGQCDTDIYGEDGILVSSQVAECPACKTLRDTLAGHGPCTSTMTSDELLYHCTLPPGHAGPHRDRDIAEWAEEATRTALSDLMKLIDEGVLVRSVIDDGAPGWALKAMRLVVALKRAQVVLDNEVPR